MGREAGRRSIEEQEGAFQSGPGRERSGRVEAFNLNPIRVPPPFGKEPVSTCCRKSTSPASIIVKTRWKLGSEKCAGAWESEGREEYQAGGSCCGLLWGELEAEPQPSRGYRHVFVEE